MTSDVALVDDLRSFLLLCIALGGSGMEIIDKTLGGYRIRVWLPNKEAGETASSRCRSHGWRSNLMRSYSSSLGMMSEDGMQLTVEVRQVRDLRRRLSLGDGTPSLEA